MRILLGWAMLAGSLSLMIACSNGDYETKQDSVNPDELIFSGQIQALERARNVEQTILTGDNIRRKKIEEMMR